MDDARVRRDLLAWYDDHARDLPWRYGPGTGPAAPDGARAPDPYRVWLSEVMLQQTRVETVLPRYAAWLQRFPDVHALAAASEQEVLAAWSGLGYYRRARLLHAAARRITIEGWPRDRAGWRALPGIGDYTAGAIASIVHGERVPAVDGNVVRVLSRLGAIHDPVDEADGRRQVERMAAELVDADRPGDWNQALMDLGATVCLPRAPRCPECPVAGLCAARAAGEQDALPRKAPKARPVPQTHHFALITQGERVWLVERAEGLLAGTWFLPGGGGRDGLERRVRRDTGVSVRLGPFLGSAQHVFTHRHWTMHVHAAQAEGEPLRGRWVDLQRPDVALSTAVRRALAAGRRD